MDIILQIIEYTFYIGLIGGVIYATVSYLDYSKHKKAKVEIQNLEAKLITLKMALKVKIKTKINSFRTQFAKIIAPENEIDKAITSLSSISYDSSEDFQKHFDISRQINTLINTDRSLNYKIELPATPEVGPDGVPVPEAPSIKLLEEFMGPDYKNEISIIRVIKEIADTKSKLSKKIEDYNEEYKDNKKRPPMKKVDPLEFNALADINLVFKDSDLILKEMQKKHSELYFKKMAA